MNLTIFDDLVMVWSEISRLPGILLKISNLPNNLLIIWPEYPCSSEDNLNFGYFIQHHQNLNLYNFYTNDSLWSLWMFCAIQQTLPGKRSSDQAQLKAIILAFRNMLVVGVFQEEALKNRSDTGKLWNLANLWPRFFAVTVKCRKKRGHHCSTEVSKWGKGRWNWEDLEHCLT